VRKHCFLLIPTLVGLAGAAQATPKYNPFTYTYETLGEGEVELEQYADIVPLKGRISTGAALWFNATQFQTEFEYGITDRLELGLYVSFVPWPSAALPSGGNNFLSLTEISPMLEGNGIKQRLRYRIADADELPVDIALYGEVVENDREIELEGKIILQKRFDALRLDVNLWGEREFYLDGHSEWVINPTAAISYQVTPSIFPGVEAWLRSEYPDNAPSPRPFNLGPAGYVGPTLSVNFGKFWTTAGVYYRFTDTSHTLEPGDLYSNVWIRTIVGVDL
jgi:hypothetical protein